MKCPRCEENNSVKDGMVRGRQRFLCKACGFRYTVSHKADVKTEEVRKIALHLYLEGLSFRMIGRLLNISYGTVYRWVKDWEAKAMLPHNAGAITTVTAEEMNGYVDAKKTFPGHGLLLVDLQNGFSLLCIPGKEGSP